MRLNFKRLGLLSGKAARACAAVGGLTSARADFLSLLLVREEVQIRIASMLCVSQPVVSRMVRALEAQGLVRRRRAPWNRQYKIVTLTELGRRHLSQALAQPLTGQEATGERSAQCIGEREWVEVWRQPLERLGLQLDSVLDLPRVELPTFRAMQLFGFTPAFGRLFFGVDAPDPRP